MLKVLENDVWVERQPVEGEAYREYKLVGTSNEHFVEGVWVDLVEPLTLVVTSPVSNRAIVSQGGNVDLTVEIRQGESVATVTDDFAMPIKRVGGAVERTVLVSFVDGVCSKSIAFNDSGEFEVSQELVNMHLPSDSHFVFDGFYISVVES